MKLPNRVHKNLLVVLVASLLLLPVVSGALNPRGQESDKPVGGLQIAVFPDPDESGHGKVPKFRVELRNVGDDMILDLGNIIGKKQNPANIALTLFDARGRSLHLMDLTQPMYVGGWVGPMFLPLPAGSRFSIAVDLARYWLPPVTDDEFEKPLAPGTYWLQAQFSVKGDSQPEREFGCGVRTSWSGTITSNRLRFDIPSQ